MEGNSVFSIAKWMKCEYKDPEKQITPNSRYLERKIDLPRDSHMIASLAHSVPTPPKAAAVSQSRSLSSSSRCAAASCLQILSRPWRSWKLLLFACSHSLCHTNTQCHAQTESIRSFRLFRAGETVFTLGKAFPF